MTSQEITKHVTNQHTESQENESGNDVLMVVEYKEEGSWYDHDQVD